MAYLLCYYLWGDENHNRITKKRKGKERVREMGWGRTCYHIYHTACLCTDSLWKDTQEL